MKITLPKHFLGKSVVGTLERVLAGTPTSTPTSSTTPPSIVTTPTITDPQNYIILRGASHGKYSYGDILVAKHRLGKSTLTELAGQQLGVVFENTSQEKDNTPYIGNINWQTALKLNLTLGNCTLRPRQFIDFLLHLRKGADNKTSVHDGRGTKIVKAELKNIYQEIVEERDPYRAEWLDAHFRNTLGEFRTTTAHVLNGTDLVAQGDEPLLTGYVMEDAYVDIASANAQGLPTNKSRKQEFYFWHPHNGKVARFDADSVRAVLSCGRNPSYALAGLGVRAAREKK